MFHPRTWTNANLIFTPISTTETQSRANLSSFFQSWRKMREIIEASSSSSSLEQRTSKRESRSIAQHPEKPALIGRVGRVAREAGVQAPVWNRPVGLSDPHDAAVIVGHRIFPGDTRTHHVARARTTSGQPPCDTSVVSTFPRNVPRNVVPTPIPKTRPKSRRRSGDRRRDPCATTNASVIPSSDICPEKVRKPTKKKKKKRRETFPRSRDTQNT